MPESLRPLDAAIAALATFRLCRFTTADGFPPMRRLRDGIKARYGVDSPQAELATCPWCQSLWLGPVVALALKRWSGARWVLLGPAISGVVGLLSTLDSYLGVDVGEDAPVLADVLTGWKP